MLAQCRHMQPSSQLFKYSTALTHSKVQLIVYFYTLCQVYAVGWFTGKVC